MARDRSVAVREFVVTGMAAAAPVAALTADRVYGPSAPARPVWPFITTDLPTATPDPDGCGGGERYGFNIHGFAKGDDERAVGALANVIVEVVDEMRGELPGGGTVTDTVWTGTQLFKDIAEVKGWHAVVSVYCRVSG